MLITERAELGAAYALWVASDAAYLSFLDPDAIKRRLAVVELELVAMLRAKHLEAIVVQGDRFSAIAWRGTQADQLADIATDLDVYDLGDDNVLHAGFDKAHQALAPQLRLALESMKGPRVGTGHSLGGGQAGAADIRMPGAFDLLCTFGAPAYLRRRARHLATTPHWRFVNAGDLVPRVPPGFMGFARPGTLHYFTSTAPFGWGRERLIVNPGGLRTAGRYLVNKVFRRGSGWRDHRVRRYGEEIAGAIEDAGSLAAPDGPLSEASVDTYARP